MTEISRRRFVQTTAIASGLASASLSSVQGESGELPTFTSRWHRLPDRVWIGPEYWSNPLQDWRIEGGRVECTTDKANRHLHILTHQLADRVGTFSSSVTVGVSGLKAFGEGRGSVGFRLGVQGPLKEYRNNLIFGKGLDVGVTAKGVLYIGNRSALANPKIAQQSQVRLEVEVGPAVNAFQVTITAKDSKTGDVLGEFTRTDIAGTQLVGNIALISNVPGRTGKPGKQAPRGRRQPSPNGDRFWFANWSASGTKLDVHPEQTFGPVLFTQYTQHQQEVKLTAQMPPLGSDDLESVTLRLLHRRNAAPITHNSKWDPVTRLAAFRFKNPEWDVDLPYEVVWTQNYTDGKSESFTFQGTIRKEPVDQESVSVADVSCNHHAAFPNHPLTANVAKLNPDMLAFTGDQFYESSGGYGVQRGPLDIAVLDYLRKWYMHGWTWRELTKDRPSVSLPDDHDVYQGNIWGESGAGKQKTQEMGGYGMDPKWVNVVHATQTAHHPDPHNAMATKTEITAYHGPMTYGGISFAILADRMFKTGPEGNVPETKGRGDHVTDPNFDPKTADLPGLELLGDDQMEFLEKWVENWEDAKMKAVISQTIFTAMATTHGGNRQRLRADYDANGWPQTPRDQALRMIRKAFAVHLAGDQHLPAVVQYGIDDHNDAGVAFAGPAVNVGYPRWFEPESPGKNRKPNAPKETGEFTDHFGNPLTVHAVANGAVKPRVGTLERLHDKTSGIGLVHFNKKARTITIECWPYLVDPTQPDTQFEGWPLTFKQQDNGRKAVGYLPTLKLRGMTDAIVNVRNELTDELEYALRIEGDTFRPPIYDLAATYQVTIGEHSDSQSHVLSGLSPAESGELEIVF